MEADKRGPKLSVVIPVYNKRDTIAHVLQCVQAVEIEKEIIILSEAWPMRCMAPDF